MGQTFNRNFFLCPVVKMNLLKTIESLLTLPSSSESSQEVPKEVSESSVDPPSKLLRNSPKTSHPQDGRSKSDHKNRLNHTRKISQEDTKNSPKFQRQMKHQSMTKYFLILIIYKEKNVIFRSKQNNDYTKDQNQESL